VYRQYDVKHAPVFSDQGVAVTYTDWHYYVFDANETGAHLNPYEDKLTLVNVPLVAIFTTLVKPTLPDDEWWEMLVFDLIATHTNASLFKTGLHANETIFGYTDPTLEFLASVQHVPTTMFKLQANYSSVADAAHRIMVGVRLHVRDYVCV
jgi:hypothetical protein